MNFPAAAPCRRRQDPRGGFTLMEVIIAMVIFVMLAASVFGILGSVLQAASSLQDNQNRREQLEALQAFLRNQLRGLSADDKISSYLRDGEGLRLSGVVWGNGSLASVLDAKIQPNGYYQLRFARVSKANLDANNAAAGTDPIHFLVAAVQSDETPLPWVSLIRDVRVVGWRFQPQQSSQWRDFWNNGAAFHIAGLTGTGYAAASNKPGVVEFTVQLAGDTQPVVMDFWITNIQPAPASTVTAPAAPTPINPSSP